MSYRVKLGDITEKKDENTGETIIYSLEKVKHSYFDEEYIIYERQADSGEPAKIILSLWSGEAQKLIDLLKG